MPEWLRSPVDWGKALLNSVSEDEVSGLSAELAYRFFLAFVPFLIFLAALSGFAARMLGVEDPAEEIGGWLEGFMPEDAAAVFGRQLEPVLGQRNPGLLSFGIIGTIYAATGGTSTLMKRIDKVYGVRKQRSFLGKMLVSIVLVIGGGLFLLAAVAVLFGAQLFGEAAAEALGLEAWGHILLQALTFLVVFGIIAVGVMLLYRIAVNAPKAFGQVLPGAVIAAGVWIIATWLFTIYVANFGQYGNTYGALAGVIILLVWFYLSNFVVLLGAEINDLRDRRQKRQQASAIKEQPSGELPLPEEAA